MKKVLILLFVFAVALASFSTAFAAPPCNDTNGDGSPSGYEYATYHIVQAAHAGGLGDGGHKPGSHHGFSACSPSE